MGRTGKKSEGAERGFTTANEQILEKYKDWNWMDGDVGRLKYTKLDGKNVVVDLAPRFSETFIPSKRTKQIKSEQWYMDILEPSWLLNPYSENTNVSLVVKRIPVPSKYIDDKFGYRIDEKKLDKSANRILKKIKKCPECGKYSLSSHEHVLQNIQTALT